MKNVIEWYREEQGWRKERCCQCGGHGLVGDYGNGEDFYGAKECDRCEGAGSYWRTPKGRTCLYPGGPFC